jgi:hypothetical protein
MLDKISVPGSSRKHSVCDYQTEQGAFLLDLTLLRKATGFQSVPYYSVDNGTVSIAGYRSVKWIHEHDDIY